MDSRSDRVPYPAGFEAALFGVWRVGTPERQESAVAAIAAAWETRPWPGPGLGSYSVLVGDDGETLLHFSLIDGADAVAGQDLSWKHDVDMAVPGIERLGVVAARLQHSSPAYAAANDARCVVLVTREFDGPDVDRAQRLVEAMFAGSAETPPAAGLISAHFYVSLDGSQVFNYALWTSVQAHHDAMKNRPPQLVNNAQWRQAHAWPGLVSTTFKRFRPRLHLAPR